MECRWRELSKVYVGISLEASSSPRPPHTSAFAVRYVAELRNCGTSNAHEFEFYHRINPLRRFGAEAWQNRESRFIVVFEVFYEVMFGRPSEVRCQREVICRLWSYIDMFP